MQFLFPNVLWGLLAMSIPVIVHLFNFRRTKKVFFSNVALLKAVETKTSAFRKLKNLLVMAARMLMIAMLVLAFAQPMWYKNSTGKNIKPVGINGIYLDNSMSMQNTSNNKKFLDIAILRIDELLSLFNKANNLQFNTNDFVGQDQYLSNGAKIKDRLTTIKYSFNPRTIDQIYKRQHGIGVKNNPSAENHLFMFSDFQKSTAGDLSKLKVETNDKLYIIPIDGVPTQNVFVDSVWLNVPLVREMQNNKLNVKVTNSGQKAVEKLSLKLYIDGVQSSTSSVDIAAQSNAVASFNFTVKSRGTHKGKIEFNDQPITFDNDHFFVLNASPTIRVMHLFEQRSPENYIGKMYANDSLFNFSSYSLNSFDPAQIQNANFVILEGINGIDGGLKAALGTFVNNGGSVCIIPGENASAASLNGFMSLYGVNGFQTLNGVPSPQNFIEIAEPDKASPFFEDVFEKGSFNAMASLPRAFPKFSWTGQGERLLSFKNGKTFLSHVKVKAGNIYLMATPLMSKMSNFGEHAYFVPSFYKMAYLSSKYDRISYDFNDQNLSFYMPDAPKNATYKLKNGKFEIIPVQRLQNNMLSLSMPNIADLSDGMRINAGFYDLVINNKAVKTIALNHDAKESLMDKYSAEDLRGIFKNQANIKVFDNIYDDGFKTAFENTSEGKSLWKYFIWAALLFILIEILLIKFLKG